MGSTLLGVPADSGVCGTTVTLVFLAGVDTSVAGMAADALETVVVLVFWRVTLAELATGTLVTRARPPLIIVMSGEGSTRLGGVVVLGETRVLLGALCVALGIAAT